MCSHHALEELRHHLVGFAIQVVHNEITVCGRWQLGGIAVADAWLRDVTTSIWMAMS
jgi:hypothetical protein